MAAISSIRDYKEMAEVSRRYRTRFYENYAGLKERSTVEQIKRDNLRREPYLRRCVTNFFPRDPSARIVDLGCGNGSLLLVLKRSGFRNIAGVETSPDQVELARHVGLDCVTQADLRDYLASCEAESFDVVVAFDVLEHFAKDEIIDVLLEINRVLAPNGRLVLHVPNAEGIFPASIYWSDFTHETAFTREGLRQVGSATGFTFVCFAEDKPVVHGVKSLIRRVVWAFVRNFFRLVHMSETGDSGAGLVLTRNMIAIATKDKQTSTSI